VITQNAIVKTATVKAVAVMEAKTVYVSLLVIIAAVKVSN